MTLGIAAAANGAVFGTLVVMSVVWSGWFAVPLAVYGMFQPPLFMWCSENLYRREKK